jgi:hypothetical protein
MNGIDIASVAFVHEQTIKFLKNSSLIAIDEFASIVTADQTRSA